MMPELFKIGPFTVYSYGLMLGISFIVASWLLTKEFQRRKLPADFANEITLLAIIFGVVGSKLMYVIENFGEFAQDPLGSIFSPGGLTFYGGLLLVIAVIMMYARRKKLEFLMIADAAAPSLAIAYGIGRLGCHLAGDGDYGIPTSLPWGVNYEHGIVPPAYLFNTKQFAQQFPTVASWFPSGIPNNTPLHPTPVYEFLGGVFLFTLLYTLRTKEMPVGKKFGLYLMFAGIFRFSVEFIRLNERIALGLSAAQLISVGLFGLGIYLYYRNKQQTV